MANEIKVTTSLNINNGNQQFRNTPTSFSADMTGTKGPSPGAVEVSPSGTDIDLSEIDTLGFCQLQNLDATNYVTYGIYSPDSLDFYPLGELLAGEVAVFRLSRILDDPPGTSGARSLRFVADTAACDVIVNAFER